MILNVIINYIDVDDASPGTIWRCFVTADHPLQRNQQIHLPSKTMQVYLPGALSRKCIV